ncbi:MAG TPA: hypothetical protein VFA26_21845, partial [Gemmataceae bacterium]|nr:hypothetical protein [Gemmataceae bacterium]
MKRLSDTSPEAERVLIGICRDMPFERKWKIIGDTFRTARALYAAGVRLRHPAATDRDICESWLAQRFGDLPRRPCEDPAMFLSGDELRLYLEVAAILTKLGAPPVLGGSLAAAIHGYDRHTYDADVTVDPFPGKEAQLVEALGPDWYVSLPAVEEAVRCRSAFNLIHHGTGFKVDVFVRKDEPFEQSAMARGVSATLPERPDQPIRVQ